MSDNALETKVLEKTPLTRSEVYEQYDSLPPEWRRLLATCPLKITLKSELLEDTLRQSPAMYMASISDIVAHMASISDIVAHMAYETYGPNHPQAKYIPYLQERKKQRA